MLARMLGALSCLILAIALVEADEIRGTVKAVDTEKSTLTVTADDKDQTFEIPKDAKIYTLAKKKKKGKAATETTIELSAIKENAKVVVNTEKKDGKDVVTSVRLEVEKKKKKKKAAE